MVTWYYKRKISRNQSKLSEMQKEKKKILDDVTETETYKKAKEILMKFAPDQLRMTAVIIFFIINDFLDDQIIFIYRQFFFFFFVAALTTGW